MWCAQTGHKNVYCQTSLFCKIMIVKNEKTIDFVNVLRTGNRILAHSKHIWVSTSFHLCQLLVTHSVGWLR